MFEDIQKQFDAIERNYRNLKEELKDLRLEVGNINERWCRAATIAKLFDIAISTVNVIAGNPENNIKVVRASTTIDTGRVITRISYDDFHRFMISGGIKSVKASRRYGR